VKSVAKKIMDKLKSSLNTRSEEYKTNRAAMLALVETLETRQAQARAGGGERGAQKFRQEGKLLPRERLELLLDPGTPFLELSPLAAWGMYNNESPAASANHRHRRRQRRGVPDLRQRRHGQGRRGLPDDPAKDAARPTPSPSRTGCPASRCVESAGANLLYQDEVFILGGRTFANQARLSAAGIPQVALVFGSSTAGGAYVPGMSDYVVMVRGGRPSTWAGRRW
jgi:acetyl-CoA carboxylase carboxyltransferase component